MLATKPTMAIWIGPCLSLLAMSATAAQSPSSWSDNSNIMEGDAAEETNNAETGWQNIDRGEAQYQSWLGYLGKRTGCVSVDGVYYGEVFTNARGGITTRGATQYQGLLDLGLSLDFDEVGSRLPGRFFLLAQNTHGRGLTEDFIGDAQVISNIDSFDNIMQVGEYWWEFDLLDDRVTVRLGKQDLNTEFLHIDVTEHFIQSTFGLSPSTAFPTYPNQSLGGVVLADVNQWRFKFGVWNAFAKGGSFGISGDDSLLVAGELERRYAFSEGRFPGVFAIGAVYESAGQIDGQPFSPVHEYIIQFEQTVFRETLSDDMNQQGLSLFAGYYPRFPGGQTTAETIGSSFVAGMIYDGLFPHRDSDVLGVGVAWTELFQGGTNQETATEIFYRFELSQRFSIQPDVQYISSPSGIFRDALAIGARFQVGL